MPAMQKRKLGNSDLMVSPLCFGGNVFGWTVDEAASFRLLDAVVDSGINFIDTADVYSVWVPGHTGGESETIIGKWLKKSGKRNQVVIATKVGMAMTPERKGLAKAHIMRSLEDSLKRLQVDSIDLYQSHIDDPDTPMAETLEAFATLVQQGKVRAIGASQFSAERVAEALALSKQNSWPAYQTLQPLYNLYDRVDFEAALLPLCLKENIAVISFYALAAGFLSGKYRSEADVAKSLRGANVVKKYLNERGLRILAALDQVAKEMQANPAQIAVAWLLTRPGVTSPIASATSAEQLQDLVAASSLQLSQDSINLLDRASA
jgi:aryl-alcohol dehydrogenase-like predicted oxidoreductase